MTHHHHHRAVDVMGFAGGFTLGMVQAGFTLVGKRELKGGFGVPACEANRHLLGSDWQAQVGPAESWDVVPDVQVVFGNPPCSAWSVMSAKGFRGADSPILECTRAFVRYVVRTRPQIAVFESVQQAFTRPDGLALMRELRDYVEEHTGERWTLYHVRHNAYSVGGAAQRKRYFWVISRVPFGIEVPTITLRPTLNDVIGDLADLRMMWDFQPYQDDAHPWAEPQRSASGYVDGHVWQDQSPLTRRILDLMSGVEWRSGEHIGAVARRHYETHGQLPASFAATQDKIVRNDFHMGFTTPTRWHGDDYARVITGGALQLTVHPTCNRMITHREAARIMGFPDDWLIAPIRHVGGLNATWGKGITVQCGRWIGEWIHAALDDRPGSHIGTLIGDREYDIDVTHSWRIGAHDARWPSKSVVRSRDTMKLVDGDTHTMSTLRERYNMTDEVTTPRRGRPRSQDVIARDEQVFAALETPKTRAQLAEELGVEFSKVFLSLFRLRNDGRIARSRQDGKHVWSRVAESDTTVDTTDADAGDSAPVVDDAIAAPTA